MECKILCGSLARSPEKSVDGSENASLPPLAATRLCVALAEWLLEAARIRNLLTHLRRR